MEAVKIGSDDLLQTLRQEIGMLRELIVFAREKESLLLASDVEGLNAVLTKEEETVLALCEQEEVRKVKAGALASALGIMGKDVPLNKLLGFIYDPGCRKQLFDVKTELSKAVRQLSHYNGRVREHLKIRINYADFMLNVHYTPKRSSHLYNIQGNMEDQTGNISRLDYRA